MQMNQNAWDEQNSECCQKALCLRANRLFLNDDNPKSLERKFIKESLVWGGAQGAFADGMERTLKMRRDSES